MKSFHGIAFGILLTALCFSGCTGVNNWWKREHALKPLKEQYWNGELSWPEYREKKKALIAQLERTGYKTPDDMAIALREAKGDTHTVNASAEKYTEEKSDAAQLVVDNKMIKEYEETVIDIPPPPPPPPAAKAGAIDYGMLSRSMKSSSGSSRDTGIVLKPAPAPTPVPVTAPAPAPGVEMITDSNDIKWTKDRDGVVTYQNPRDDELRRPVIKSGSTPQSPAVNSVPVEQAGPSKAAPVKPAPPVDEAKADPAKAQSEPVIMDLGDISE
ncbi:hypothetical protein [Cerasicoccus arenae]|uniref:Uncharacterized protein n=1 Tax=Cerasicoccus arenae TaxID=424488 RepID=A0A8J3GE43_9BACT|nr:hypothetical protein [Cerasicoccus arenae]MBK1856866.1 hypothetical protein [Cerasicoccus arenae]GHC11374.1 hypothetical protein GCM10007047_30890 [Cerasicoccus arenae]